MKKILSTFFAVLMITSLVVPAQATNEKGDVEASSNYMIESLAERGYPSDYLDGLIPPKLEELYNLANEKNLFYLHTSNLQPIQPYGNIPSQQLSFNVTTSYTPVKYNGVTYMYEITVYVDYEWNELPIVQKIDAISVNWDSNILVYNEGFKSTDYAYSQLQKKWVIHKEWTRPSLLNQGGLGISTYINYEEKIDTDTWIGPKGISGSVVFSLTPQPRFSMVVSPGSDSTTINGEYVHNKNPFTGSLSFSYDNFSVSIDMGAMQDSIADAARIDYTRID